MVAEGQSAGTTLTGIAAILQAVTWPLVAALFFLVYRTRIGAVIDVVAQKLKEARHVKAGQIELDTASEINEVVAEAGEAGASEEIKKEIPQEQIKAARLVGEKLKSARITFTQKLDVVHNSLYELIDTYETLRRTVPRGPLRTRAMNEVAAKMRALAIGAFPLLPLLMEGERVGERLAAICILQVKHEPGYFDWLVQRVMHEEQPFVFFHASLAILEIVKSTRYWQHEAAAELIQSALEYLKSFRGGKPDQNTIDVLSEVLARLREVQGTKVTKAVGAAGKA